MQPNLAELNAKWRTAPGEWAGLTFTAIEGTTWYATFKVGPQLLQPLGLLHGGVICMLAETIGSVASATMIDTNAFNAVGQTLNSVYFRPGFLDQTIDIQATLEHGGRSSHVWQIDFIAQESAKRLARVQFIVAIAPKR